MKAHLASRINRVFAEMPFGGSLYFKKIDYALEGERPPLHVDDENEALAKILHNLEALRESLKYVAEEYNAKEKELGEIRAEFYHAARLFQRMKEVSK